MKEQRLGKEEEEEEESGFARTTGEENGRGETNGMGGRMFRFARSLSLSLSVCLPRPCANDVPIRLPIGSKFSRFFLVACVTYARIESIWVHR